MTRHKFKLLNSSVVLIAGIVFLTGCGQEHLPESPAAAAANIKALAAGAQDVHSSVGEGLSRAGSALSSGVAVTKEGLTELGDGVLAATGNEDKVKKDSP